MSSLEKLGLIWNLASISLLFGYSTFGKKQTDYQRERILSVDFWIISILRSNKSVQIYSSDLVLPLSLSRRKCQRSSCSQFLRHRKQPFLSTRNQRFIKLRLQNMQQLSSPIIRSKTVISIGECSLFRLARVSYCREQVLPLQKRTKDLRAWEQSLAEALALACSRCEDSRRRRCLRRLAKRRGRVLWSMT